MAVLELSRCRVPRLQLAILGQHVQTVLTPCLVEDWSCLVVHAPQRHTVRVKMGNHCDLEGAIEDSELPVGFVRTELVVALGKGRRQKLAPREQFAEALYRVEVDMVLGGSVDVLAPVVVDYAERLDVSQDFVMPTFDLRDELQVWMG